MDASNFIGRKHQTPATADETFHQLDEVDLEARHQAVECGGGKRRLGLHRADFSSVPHAPCGTPPEV
jgi:hypothetical protein